VSTVPNYTDAERIAAQRACVAEHIALENAPDHSIDAVLTKTFATENVFYDIVPGNAGRLVGSEGVIGFYEMLFAVLPDIHIEVVHQYDVPGCCVLEGYVTGTHSAPFGEIQPLGKRVSFPFAAMYLFAEDPTKLVAERAYWDNEFVAGQMRGDIEPTEDYVWNGPNPFSNGINSR
jgi:predicted ester cyclase